MAKTIGLKQLAQKTYTSISTLPVEIQAAIGDIEDAWDGLIWGQSANGKSNWTVQLVKALLLSMPTAKAEYVSYEEGHTKTIQDTMIHRHDMLNVVGNRMAITEHLSFEELAKKMGRKQSAKIWVIDSIQASALTYLQCKELKEKYVMSRKKKIIIYVSWADGKEPHGAVAKAVKYYANIKMPVIDFIMFPRSRYGGNTPFVIWPDGAKAKWGKQFKTVIKPLINEKNKPQPKALLRKESDHLQQDTPTGRAGEDSTAPQPPASSNNDYQPAEDSRQSTSNLGRPERCNHSEAIAEQV